MANAYLQSQSPTQSQNFNIIAMPGTAPNTKANTKTRSTIARTTNENNNVLLNQVFADQDLNKNKNKNKNGENKNINYNTGTGDRLYIEGENNNECDINTNGSANILPAIVVGNSATHSSSDHDDHDVGLYKTTTKGPGMPIAMIDNNNNGMESNLDETNYQIWSEKEVLLWLKNQLLQNGFSNE